MKRKLIESIIIFIVLCLILFTTVFINAFSSRRWSLITSNSMEPVLMTNSLVLTDFTVPFEAIEKGDIIRYTETSITDREIMHRVYQKTIQEDGSIILLTKGDNLAAVDRWTVTKEQYKGEVIGCQKWVKPIFDFVYAGNAQDFNNFRVCIISFVGITFLFAFCFFIVVLKDFIFKKIKEVWL